MQNSCSNRFVIPRSFRSLAVGVLCVLLFTQCTTTSEKKTYKSAKYTSDKLATPSGHGMKKKEYPFDDSGNYRKDWVKKKSGSRTKSSYKGYSASPKPETAEASSSSSTPPKPSSPSNHPAHVGNNPAPAVSSPPPAPAPAPAPVSKPSVRYHKVAPGDTLYSLSRKYGVSVSALQKTNGLSGNLIRKGQSLRIP